MQRPVGSRRASHDLGWVGGCKDGWTGQTKNRQRAGWLKLTHQRDCGWGSQMDQRDQNMHLMMVDGYRGPGGGFRKGQNGCGQIWKPRLIPNTSFNFQDVMCQNVCTRHGLREGWVFCALHAVWVLV